MKTDTMTDPFPRRPAVNIDFSDVTYRVTTWRKFKPEKKEILHGVSGEFRSGELTAIMGPSGAGKSTLLNILSGYTVRGSGGSIRVNKDERGASKGLEEFKKISCYIQQEDMVRPQLRVREAMSLATHLKLGCDIPGYQKQQKVSELLGMLGLAKSAETYCKDLSGGQKKRLSIALELVTNPPVIFLDEPTTGLDCVSTTSCVELLKQLAEQGRTMICTLHQPSAMLFSKFSHLYCVAEGRCIYQGPPAAMTTFFQSFGLVCPQYHNPADFLIEVASGDYPRDLDSLAQAAENLALKRSICLDKNDNTDEKGIELYNLQNRKKVKQTSDNDLVSAKCLPKPASMWLQFFHLYSRNLIVVKRDYFQIILRLVCHLLIGVIFGYLYQNVGNNAQTILANFIFVYGSNLFLHYTGQMTVLLSFPLEYAILTREHFNRWYSLLPYCLALFLVEVPLQLACAFAYLLPGYYLTAQPLEAARVSSFFMFNMAICLTAQATGFLSGAIFPVTIAVFLGPVLSVFLSVFGFASKYSDINFSMRPFYNISYFRSAFQGSFLSLYGSGRDDLPCNEFYCHYKKPIVFLTEMEMTDVQPVHEVCYILFVGVISYLFTLFSVWSKLNRR